MCVILSGWAPIFCDGVIGYVCAHNRRWGRSCYLVGGFVVVRIIDGVVDGVADGAVVGFGSILVLRRLFATSVVIMVVVRIIGEVVVVGFVDRVVVVRIVVGGRIWVCSKSGSRFR